MKQLDKLVVLDNDSMMQCGALIEQALGVMTCVRTLSCIETDDLNDIDNIAFVYFEQLLNELDLTFKNWRETLTIKVELSVPYLIEKKLEHLDASLNDWLEDTGPEQTTMKLRTAQVNAIFAASHLVMNALQIIEETIVQLNPPAQVA